MTPLRFDDEGTLIEEPITDRRSNDYRLTYGRQPSPRQLQVLAEYVTHGSLGRAADCLGMSLRTAHTHAQNLLAKTGAQTSVHALYVLGWVTIPASVPTHRGAQHIVGTDVDRSMDDTTQPVAAALPDASDEEAS